MWNRCRLNYCMEVIYATKRVEKFIINLDDNISSRIERMIDLLEKYGYDLGMPHSKSLGGGLFELRILGERQIRVLYTFRYGRIYIVHGFFKKTQQILKQEIEYARRMAKEIVA